MKNTMYNPVVVGTPLTTMGSYSTPGHGARRIMIALTRTGRSKSILTPRPRKAFIIWHPQSMMTNTANPRLDRLDFPSVNSRDHLIPDSTPFVDRDGVSRSPRQIFR